MALLLDTCTFLWLVGEPDQLGPEAARRLDDEPRLVLSDVSIWEVTQKWAADKLSLSAPPRAWCEEQAARWRLDRLAISREHLYRASELPDPFDRLLVAQALASGLGIVTPDPHIARCPVPVVW